MKRHIIYKDIIGLAVFLLFVAGGLHAQTHSSITPANNKNYVRSTKVLVEGVYGDADLNTKTIGQIQQQINYFDGLGRLQQQVQVAATPAKKDIIQPVVYDPLGREGKTYLPYESTSGSSWGVFTATATALTTQKDFHNALHGTTDGVYAYAQKRYEASPLDRVLEESAPGNAWRMGGGHTSGVTYLSDVANEVRLWKDYDVNSVVHNNAYYAKAQLYVTETTDPDGRKMREYKNKFGQVIETRQIAPNNGNKLITSYVYNNYGDLVWVIPPKAQNLTPNSADFNKLVYRYKYDGKGRLIEKQLPGAEAEYYVYDSRDRLVMSQDGNQRTANKWRVFYYDTQNRPVADGLVSSTTAVNTLRNTYGSIIVTPTANADGYTFPAVTGLPTLTANGVLGYTFYNDYAWVSTGGNNYAYTTADFPGYAYPQRMTTVKGQVTGSKIKVLDGNEETASAKWLTTVTYYDNKYRPIQVKTDLYTGATNGMATVSTLYLFDGAIDRLREKQVFNTTTTTTDLRYVYDHARRPIQVYHKVNNQAETLITQTTYDALGRAKTKTQGNAEVTTYAYNIRNWLTQITSPQFSATMYYNTLPTLPSGSTATAQFGGNIAAVVSKQGSTQTTYGYAYDEFSRLKEGIHTNSLNEKLITYDANGNITALTRQGGTNPGTFTYTYDGNKLSQLKIGSTAYNYAYDANGNTTTDGMRGFTMTYNLLNLPKRVSKGADYLDYVYDAVGNKLAKKKNNSFTQYYSGSIVYKADKTPEYVMHNEGLALNVSGTYNYQYNINDHLGNTRVVQNASKVVEQRNDYYPFGLSHSVANLQKNKYLYNGKEYQDETLGGTLFGELDYGARMYDPIIGRWLVKDPQAEIFSSFTPYNYCKNDPINRIDPDGEKDYKLTRNKGIKEVKNQSEAAAARKTDRLIVGKGFFKRIKYDKTGELENETYFELPEGSQALRTMITEDTADKDGKNPAKVTTLNLGTDDLLADLLFRFIARNTSTEWTLVEKAVGISKLYYIFTSNLQRLTHTPIDDSGYEDGTMRKNIHNHRYDPRLAPGDRNEATRRSRQPSSVDRKTQKGYEKNYPGAATFYILYDDEYYEFPENSGEAERHR